VCEGIDLKDGDTHGDWVLIWTSDDQVI